MIKATFAPTQKKPLTKSGVRIFSSTIKQGFGIGRIIGYPTLNLVIPDGFALVSGVYGCRVRIKGDLFNGILYYGPNVIVDKKLITLEIHLLPPFTDKRLSTFSALTEKEKIAVFLGVFIRKPMALTSLSTLQKQISLDINKLTNGVVNKL